MITIHSFGPAFGLLDPSPFVTKAEVLLKMAGLPYTTETGGLGKAPKGKLPYIVDDAETIADSTFIRWYLEKKYHIDFDPGLNAEQRAIAWAFERCLRIIFIGRSSMSAGWTTSTSRRGRATSSAPYRHRSGRSWSP